MLGEDHADSRSFEPKLTLVSARSFPHHRSGWGYALRSLEPLLTPGGVRLDPFIEETFNWNLGDNLARGVLPYQSAWVGFVHNPPGIPRWHEFDSAPQNILNLPSWKQSMPDQQTRSSLDQHN